MAQDSKGFRSVFWTGFFKYCAEQPGFCDVFGDVLSREHTKDCWVSFRLGTSRFHLDTLLLTRDGAVGVDVWFKDVDVYRNVYEHKEQAEALIGPDSGYLAWDDLNADKKTRTLTVKLDVNFTDDDWRGMYSWMVQQMWMLREVMQKFGE